MEFWSTIFSVKDASFSTMTLVILSDATISLPLAKRRLPMALELQSKVSSSAMAWKAVAHSNTRFTFALSRIKAATSP
eukprot:7116739-Lingulodinium_polyedra.AAC.1